MRYFIAFATIKENWNETEDTSYLQTLSGNYLTFRKQVHLSLEIWSQGLEVPVISQHCLFEQFSYRLQLFHWWGGLWSPQGGFMQVIGLRGSWRQLEAVWQKFLKQLLRSMRSTWVSHQSSPSSTLHPNSHLSFNLISGQFQGVLHHFHTPQCLVCYYTWLCTVRALERFVFEIINSPTISLWWP